MFGYYPIVNIAYNYLAGGSCLQDIELLRTDEGWLNAVGAQIIPDPTTAGNVFTGDRH